MSQEEWVDATGQAQDGKSRQIVGQEGWLRAEAVSRLASLVFQAVCWFTGLTVDGTETSNTSSEALPLSGTGRSSLLPIL